MVVVGLCGGGRLCGGRSDIYKMADKHCIVNFQPVVDCSCLHSNLYSEAGSGVHVLPGTAAL